MEYFLNKYLCIKVACNGNPNLKKKYYFVNQICEVGTYNFGGTPESFLNSLSGIPRIIIDDPCYTPVSNIIYSSYSIQYLSSFQPWV